MMILFFYINSYFKHFGYKNAILWKSYNLCKYIYIFYNILSTVNTKFSTNYMYTSFHSRVFLILPNNNASADADIVSQEFVVNCGKDIVKNIQVVTKIRRFTEDSIFVAKTLKIINYVKNAS